MQFPQASVDRQTRVNFAKILRIDRKTHNSLAAIKNLQPGNTRLAYLTLLVINDAITPAHVNAKNIKLPMTHLTGDAVFMLSRFVTKLDGECAKRAVTRDEAAG